MEKIEYILGKIEQHLSNIDERLEKLEAEKKSNEKVNIEISQLSTLVDHIMQNGCNSTKHSLKPVYAYITVLFIVFASLLTFFSLKTKHEPQKIEKVQDYTP